MDKNLNKLSKQELLTKAATMRMKTTISMKKSEIIAAINKVIKSRAKAKLVKKSALSKPAKKVVAKAKPAKKVVAKAKPAKKVVAKAKPAKKVVAKAKPAKKVVAKAKPAKKVVAKAKPVKKTTSAKPAKKISAKKSVTKPAGKVVAAKTKPAKKPTKKVAKARPVKKMVPAKPARKVAAKITTAPPVPDKPGKWEIGTASKKFFIADEQGDYQKVEGDGLPRTYGDTRIVALSRNPGQLYVYWEILREDAEIARKAIGADWAQIGWIIRLFDVTGVEFDGQNANGWVDINIGSYERDRYIDIAEPGRVYVAAIGLVNSGFRFQAIARSEAVEAPRNAAQGSAKGEWAITDDAFERLYALSGGANVGGSSLGPFGAVSSQSFLGFGSSGERSEKKDRGFFFRLDCELTVSGATHPDAQVTMMGKDIALNHDGTFSVRFALPDGLFDIPVVAISPDQIEMWEISPTVTRKTRVVRERNHDERKRA